MAVSVLAKPRKRRVIASYFWLSLGFGLFVGMLFPWYASLFVTYENPAAEALFAAGCAAAGLLVGLASFLIGRFTIVKAVKTLSVRFHNLASDGADLSVAFEWDSADSFGDLTRNFRAFMEKLGLLFSRLREVADKTRQVGFELAANTTETSAASEQISRHMDMIHGQTEVLLEEIERVNEARADINAAAVSVSANIDRQSDSLQNLSSSIERAVDEFRAISEDARGQTAVIGESIARSGGGLDEIAEVAGRIREIAAAVGKIDELAVAIDQIAERISILGMNASIEAAHAGEAGRGFSVVAGEISKLSELAGANSAEIGSALGAVRSLLEDGVLRAGAAQERLSSILRGIEGSTGALGAVSERLSGISLHSDSMVKAHAELVRVTIDLTDSMVEMRDSTEVIGDSVSVLKDSADQYRLAIDEIAQGIKEISVDVAHLHSISSVNADNTRYLEAELGRFSGGGAAT